MPLCFEKVLNEEFEFIDIFLVRVGLGEGDNGTGAGRESITGSWGSRHVDNFLTGDVFPGDALLSFVGIGAFFLRE